MNKERFLEELREYIQVLEEQEQEDILEEYAQHIDMKIQKGLSEEEAIQDFGPMKVLAAEILEAYHVKPEYGQKKRTFLLAVKQGEGEKTGDNALIRAGRWIKEKGAAAGRGVKSFFRWGFRKCRALTGWLGKPFRHRRRSGTEDFYEVEDKRMEGIDEESVYTGQTVKDSIPVSPQREGAAHGRVGDLFRMAGRGCVKIWRLFGSCCIFCLRLFWNMAWLLFSLLCVCFAMTALAGFGMLLILFFQDYPFGGILLVSLGVFLCFGSLACGAFSMLIRKAPKGQETELQRNEPGKPDEAFTG